LTYVQHRYRITADQQLPTLAQLLQQWLRITPVVR